MRNSTSLCSSGHKKPERIDVHFLHSALVNFQKVESGGCFGRSGSGGEERTECGKGSIFFRQGGPYRVHTICSFLYLAAAKAERGISKVLDVEGMTKP